MDTANPDGFARPESFQCAVAKLVLMWIVSTFASLTVLTHVAQLTGLRFDVYVVVGVITMAVVTAVVARFEIPKITTARIEARRAVTAALLACCLFGALLCLVSYNISTDDCFYVPNAVYYLENPSSPMGFATHYIDSGGSPFVSYHRGSIPFEYSQAIPARIARLHYLTMYHVLTPALIGFLIPLGWFYALSRFFKSTRAVVWGALLICLCLLLMGGTLRSFGNFAFNRVYQGKTVLFALGLPVFTALTVDYFRSPGVRNWVYLFALSVAAIGCTVAAAILIPLLALVLAVAAAVSYVTDKKERIVRGVLYLCALAYPAVYAVTILLFSAGDVGSESALNTGWPETFMGHAKFVLGDPAAIVFLTIGTVAAPVVVEGKHRRFIGIWLVLTAVLYLNPVVGPYLIKYVTSPNIYWRLFYLLPFPLVIGLSGAGLVERLENVRKPWRTLPPAAITAALLLAHIPGSSTSVFRAHTTVFEDKIPMPPTEFRAPGYKVAHLDLVRRVLDASPPEGTMLATQKISTAVAMLTARYKHVCYRNDGIRMWFQAKDRQEEGRIRTLASYYLDGRTGMNRGFVAVLWLIRRYPQINTVVALQDTTKPQDRRLIDETRIAGFEVVYESPDMVIMARP